MQLELQIFSTVLTVLGAGLGIYVGLRVAVAEFRKDLEAVHREIESHDLRLKRLEDPYFNPKH